MHKIYKPVKCIDFSTRMNEINQTETGNQMNGKEIRAKIIRETKYLAYVMVEVNNQIMISMIVDKERKVVVGVGTSRREAFRNAKNNADEEIQEKIEELELE